LVERGSRFCTPALLNRTWSFVSEARKREADALIVERSLRSRDRKTNDPLDVGEALEISSIAFVTLLSDRAAM
jgi:hypothetical protein